MMMLFVKMMWNVNVASRHFCMLDRAEKLKIHVRLSGVSRHQPWVRFDLWNRMYDLPSKTKSPPWTARSHIFWSHQRRYHKLQNVQHFEEGPIVKRYITVSPSTLTPRIFLPSFQIFLHPWLLTKLHPAEWQQPSIFWAAPTVCTSSDIFSLDSRMTLYTSRKHIVGCLCGGAVSWDGLIHYGTNGDSTYIPTDRIWTVNIQEIQTVNVTWLKEMMYTVWHTVIFIDHRMFMDCLHVHDSISV